VDILILKEYIKKYSCTKIAKAPAHFRLGKLIGFGWKMVMITKLNDVSDLIAGIASN